MMLIFLSTLSLRRATDEFEDWTFDQCISIHALLAESDHRPQRKFLPSLLFLSTLSLRRATPYPFSCENIYRISIHALLAESDSHLFGD